MQNGFVESLDKLLSDCRMLMSQCLTNWEKLWRCDRLENEEFIQLLKQEKKKFFGKKLEFVFEVAHLAGILLSLEKRGLAKLNRKYVVSVAKANIRNIFIKYPDDFAHTMLNTQGYEFQESETEEMKEILSYANQLFNAKVKKVEESYVKGVWEKLTPGITCEDLERLFDKATPTNRCSYSMECVFCRKGPM